MTDTLHQEPERDHFRSESPIRAFTAFQVEGRYALGKGFRPSLAHLVTYLNAMHEKEGWKTLQVLEAGTQTPSFLFVREACPIMPEIADKPAAVELKARMDQRDYGDEQPEKPIPANVYYGLDGGNFYEMGTRKGMGLTFHEEWWPRRAEFPNGPDDEGRMTEDKPCLVPEDDGFVTLDHFDHTGKIGEVAVKAVTEDRIVIDLHKTRPFRDIAEITPEGYVFFGTDIERENEAIFVKRHDGPPKPADDPVNPSHYAGRACADIGERLSANGYQILKYCWRLGKKDDPVQELGKALWYLDSELALMEKAGMKCVLPSNCDLASPSIWFLERIKGQPAFTMVVARRLWDGYRATGLRILRDIIQAEKTRLEGCTTGLAL